MIRLKGSNHDVNELENGSYTFLDENGISDIDRDMSIENELNQ